MNNTFPDFPINSSSIDGLDSLFTINCEVGPAQEPSAQEGLPTPPPTKGIPVNIAAKRLGISSTSILKRLRKGTLRGFKEATKYGERWMVLSDELTGTTQVPPTPGNTLATPKVYPPTEDTPYGTPLLIEHLEKEKTKLEQQVQALTWRNGYLESKVEEQNKAIKLLEDQRKAPWWHSIWSWFIGSNS